MASSMKRKRNQNKGLAAGERLKRDKLASAEAEHSQWGWVSRMSEQSQITREHKLAAYGFLDTIRKPICRNKFAESSGLARKKRKIDVGHGGIGNPMEVEESDDIIVISSEEEDQPTCTKKSCRDNPHCLNHLGQARLENEEAALKDYCETSGLGYNPLENARDPSLPVGLKNLGATCYANAFIPSFNQVWFQDHAFRDGVYRCVPSQHDYNDIEESPIFQLQVTFAALQEGICKVFNPVKLVESLQLRASEQQDAQEFSKLFMSHLATEFEKQAVPSLKTLVANQFEGRLTYGTLCKNCQNRSERDADFLELEISIEGNGKLESRIEGLLQSEELSGDNKYLCTHCGSLQDAERYTRLRKLPPVLHFSVLRFVFDLATLSRKKSKKTILFPPVIDMSPFVGMKSEESDGETKSSNMIYELRGVLLHKGASAYHGHYEAQVYDVTNKQFYQFNDEEVTPIKSLHGKKKASDDKETNGTSTANRPRKNNGRKKKRIDDSDSEPSNNMKIDDFLNYISSKDAYMLIYARRDASASRDASQPLLVPPKAARERVANLNKKHEDACTAFAEWQKRLSVDFNDLRQKKRNVYRVWNIEDMKEDSATVSRAALEGWLLEGLDKPPDKPKESGPEPDTNGHVKYSSRALPSDVIDQPKDSTRESDSPDPLDAFDEGSAHSSVVKLPNRVLNRWLLDNRPIMCQHGALDPRKTAEMKRIKKNSLSSIKDMGYMVVPEFTTDNVCSECIAELFIERRYSLDHVAHVETFEELYDTDENKEGVWISKAWLRDWRQPMPKMHIHGRPDPHPEAPDYVEHVKCPHGNLSYSSALRTWINARAFTFLKSLFPTWHPTIVPSDAPSKCSDCEAAQTINKEARQEIKQRVDREKERLKGLMSSYVASNDSINEPGVFHAIVGADFIRRVRAWINKPHDNPRPDEIDNSWLICKHKGLVVDPDAPQDLGSTIIRISFEDWTALKNLYGGGPFVPWTTASTRPDRSDDDIVSQNQFAVCTECRHDRLMNFMKATITVCLIEQSPKKASSQETLKEEDLNVVGEDHREPSVSRTTRSGQPVRSSNRIKLSKRKSKTQTINITKESTVKDIKIELHEEFKIPTICQRLFYKGKELGDNSETVASLGILANDILDLREVKEKDDTDSDIEVDSQRKPRDEGRAFGGTILSGGGRKPTLSSHSSPEPIPAERHCPACTFINPADLSICSMCESSLDL